MRKGGHLELLIVVWPFGLLLTIDQNGMVREHTIMKRLNDSCRISVSFHALHSMGRNMEQLILSSTERVVVETDIGSEVYKERCEAYYFNQYKYV